MTDKPTTSEGTQSAQEILKQRPEPMTADPYLLHPGVPVRRMAGSKHEKLVFEPVPFGVRLQKPTV